MKIIEIKFSRIYKYLTSVKKKNPLSLTWVNCSSNDSAQRVPGPVVKPVMEFIESLLSQEPGSPIIKVPIARKKRSRLLFILKYFHQFAVNFAPQVTPLRNLIIFPIKSVWYQKLC